MQLFVRRFASTTIGICTTALVLLMLKLGPAYSADIALLSANPVAGPDYSVLNLGNGVLVNKGLDGSSSAQAIPRDRTDGNNKWAFEGGLGLDGSMSFESVHFDAAWGALLSSRVIKVSGTITRGDTDKLRALVDASGFSECLKPGYCPFNNTIAFDSPGGNLVEAIKMGEYIASQNFATLLDRGAICESACSFSFLGGFTNYEGFFYPRRFAHETAVLGVHRPFFQLPERSFSADEVSQIITAINTGVTAATQYMLKVGVSLGFLQSMYATDPTEMYHLTPLESSSENIIVLGQVRKVSELTRRQIFSYCSNLYLSKYSDASPELLDNLQTDGSTFLTFVTGKDFVCAGAKLSTTNTWASHICLDASCGLSSFAQAELSHFQDRIKDQRIWDVASDIDNGSIGYAFKAHRHRSVSLKYIRLFAEVYDSTNFEDINPVALQAPVPQVYCSEIDGFNPGLILTVQDLLNKNGIDVGKPDGAAGPNTRRGIQKFNASRLGRDVETVDALLLNQMGLPPSTIAEYRLCP